MDWRFWIMLSYGCGHLEAKILKKITCFSKIYNDKRLVYSTKTLLKLDLKLFLGEFFLKFTFLSYLIPFFI